LPALDVHHAPEARPGQAVLVLAGDLAGAATDAVHVVVDEAELLAGLTGS
jgi:trimethylamine:corrinoid methyltransferase-like protein